MAYEDILNELESKLNSIATGHVANDGTVSPLLNISIVEQNGESIIRVQASDRAKTRFGQVLGAETGEKGVTELRGHHATAERLAQLLGLPVQPDALAALTGMRDPTLIAIMEAARNDEGAKIGQFLIANDWAGLERAAERTLRINERAVLPEGADKPVVVGDIERLAVTRREGLDVGSAMAIVDGRLQRVEITTVPDNLSPLAQQAAVETILAKYALSTSLKEQGLRTPAVKLHYDVHTGHPVLSQEVIGGKIIPATRNEAGDFMVSRGDIVAGVMKISMKESLEREYGDSVIGMSAWKFTRASLLNGAISSGFRDYSVAAGIIAIDRAGAEIALDSVIMAIDKTGKSVLLGMKGVTPAIGEHSKAPVMQQHESAAERYLARELSKAPDCDIVMATVKKQADSATRRMSQIMTGDLLERGYLTQETAYRYMPSAAVPTPTNSAAGVLVAGPAGRQSFPSATRTGVVNSLMRDARRVSGNEP